jgi:SNF2 family DNA or RNA helicase
MIAWRTESIPVILHQEFTFAMEGLPKYSAGHAVVRITTRDLVGTVIGERFRQNGEFWYRVRFGATVQAVLEDDLEPFVETSSIETLVESGVYSSHDSLARRLTLAKLQSPLRDAIYSLDSSRTEFHAYQFKPLFKFLNSDRNRLLIADEVGLGKTIEAGYILREQRARFDIDRILVVCPAALRHKWQVELATRFGEQFEIYTAPTFRGWLARDDGRKRLQGIVSMQTLRTENLLDQMEQKSPPLDLLIVDEAHHHRNRETAQHRAVRQLSISSDAIVFLTATPLHLGNQDLFNLLNLLLPEDFDRIDVFEQRLRVNEHIVRAETALRFTREGRTRAAADSLRRASAYPDPFALGKNRAYTRVLSQLDEIADDDLAGIVEIQEELSQLNLISHVVTRTKKRDAYPDAAKRDPVIFSVEFTQAERIAYDTVYAFCAEHYTRTIGNWAAQFPLIMLQRQMASSIPAMLEHYRRVIEERAIQEEDDELDDDAPESVTPLVDIPGFGSLIDELLDLPLARDDTKLAALVKVLDRAGSDKVVVFSYFRGSLRYLERRLNEAGIECARIDGSVPYNLNNPEEDERQIRINRFRDPLGPRVLLSSEVGSEGLDFQFCHTLVNWDLPWNPMVVEQRIGRLDRFGQKAQRISIVNFSTPGTIEDRVLNRLYARVGLFEGAIGALEPILGAAIKELTAELLQPHLTPQEIDELVERKALALQTRLRLERQFESESESLLGHDDVVRDRIERVRRLGRYVTPAELQIFVADFLSVEHPDASLRSQHDGTKTRDAGDGCFWMRMTPGLRQFVRQRTERLDDPGLLRFLERAPSADVRVTFDPMAALAAPAVEQIHNQHPLVKAIASFLAENPDRIQPVCRVTLSTDLVPVNDYAFFWAEVNEEGLQAGRSIWAEVAQHDGTGRIPSELAEQLLYEMIVAGEGWAEFEPPDGARAIELIRTFEGWISERCLRRRAIAQEQNDGRVNARLASLKASTDAKLAIVRGQLEQHRLRGNQRILPAVEGKLRKIEADFEQRQRQLEDGRKVSLSYAARGFGYVRVVNKA